MSTHKIDITFILPSLVAGGAERVLSLIATNLDKERFNTTLLVVGFEKDKVYNVDGINVIYLNKPRVLKGIPGIFKYILKNRPSIIVSCMAHLSMPVAAILKLFPNIKLVTREANIKSVTKIYNPPRRSWSTNQLSNGLYQRTDCIICQSQDMAKEMMTEYAIPKSKLVVINNPISDEFVLKSKTSKNKITQYITVGRLHDEKGHDRILRNLSKLSFPFHYTIIGDGEAYQRLFDLVEELNMSPQVTFIPYTREIPKFLRESNLYLQGSYAEGFPNALLESCAVGTPVLAYDALGGTSEIILEGVNGYSAKNDDDYFKYLNQIHEEPELQPDIVSNSVYVKFNKTTIIKKYEDVFLRLVKP